MANPYNTYLQKQYFIQFMLNDFYSYMLKIANNETIEFKAPPNDIILTEQDKIQFLTYIGNIVNLPFFTVSPLDGFQLDVSQLDLSSFGGGANPSDITSSEYSNCLLSRFYRIYSNVSINNIINTVQLCSQTPLTGISVDTTSTPNTIAFTITNPSPRAEYFIEYLDSKGYNIWMKPQFGTVTFTYIR